MQNQNPSLAAAAHLSAARGPQDANELPRRGLPAEAMQNDLVPYGQAPAARTRPVSYLTS